MKNFMSSFKWAKPCPGWVCGVIFLDPRILLRIMITANGDQIIHVRILLDCRDCPLQNQTMTAIIIAYQVNTSDVNLMCMIMLYESAYKSLDYWQRHDL